MISATHAHTGPELANRGRRSNDMGGLNALAVEFTEALPTRIAETVRRANEQLQPAHLSAAKGLCEQLTFNRRQFMRDGTVGWNPGKLNPNIVMPAGPTDPEVGLLYVRPAGADDPRQAMATYVNFAMHPDTCGGSQDQRRLARRARAGSSPATTVEGHVTLVGNGTCGNLNHLGLRLELATKHRRESHRIGTILGAAVFQAYKDLKPVAAGTLQAKSERSSNSPCPKSRRREVEEAKLAIAATKDDAGGNFMKLVRSYRALDIAGREGKPHRVEVQVIALGQDVAWVSLPGEIFVELGLAIKKAVALPAHVPRRVGQREHRLHSRPPQLCRRELRTRKRPLRRRLRRTTRRGGRPTPPGAETLSVQPFTVSGMNHHFWVRMARPVAPNRLRPLAMCGKGVSAVKNTVHTFVQLCLAALLTTSLSAQLAAAAAETPSASPNIVVILADDLGYGDVACYNDRAQIATPHLDRLARQGMRFTDAHSPATACTPSRYSLMTGQMAFRVPRGGTVFTGVGGPSLISPGRLTLPAMLRSKGYATACVGKWHVGLTFFDHEGRPVSGDGVEAVQRVDFSRRVDGGPVDHGFDRFFGTACCPTTDWLYAFLDGDRVRYSASEQDRQDAAAEASLRRRLPAWPHRAGLPNGGNRPHLPREEPRVSRVARAKRAGQTVLSLPCDAGSSSAVICRGSVQGCDPSRAPRRFYP